MKKKYDKSTGIWFFSKVYLVPWNVVCCIKCWENIIHCILVWLVARFECFLWIHYCARFLNFSFCVKFLSLNIQCRVSLAHPPAYISASLNHTQAPVYTRKMQVLTSVTISPISFYPAWSFLFSISLELLHFQSSFVSMEMHSDSAPSIHKC